MSTSISERTFFHGTSADNALLVLQQGFKIGQEVHGRLGGYGLYLTTDQEYAALHGDVIIHCQIVRGARILKSGPFDRRVIDQLTRRFGTQIKTSDFWKALPNNKKLTRIELVNLYHYLSEDRKQKANFSRLFSHLRSYGFDGVHSEDNDGSEAVIFNPSLVKALEAFSVRQTGWDLDRLSGSFQFEGPLGLERLQELSLSQIPPAEE